LQARVVIQALRFSFCLGGNASSAAPIDERLQCRKGFVTDLVFDLHEQSKLVAVDDQSDDDIVHRDRL
jgi:hypothetical protein